MFGLEGAFATWELNALASVFIGLLAFSLGYLVRRGRDWLSERISPIAIDLISSVLLVTIVIATALAIASLWGQTETLLEELGFLRLEARASQITMTLVVLVAIQVILGIVARLLDDFTEGRKALSAHQREVTFRTTQVAVWITGIIVILGIWAVDLTGLLVGAGFLGIVLGLAARKTLGSLLSGFVLMFSRPFEVGDWIIVDGYSGHVTDITLMSTRVSAFDGEYIIVPNDVITGETVVNRSRQDRLRVAVEIGVDYETDIDVARSIAQSTVEEVAKEHDAAIEDPTPDVLVLSFGDSAVLMTVRIWVQPSVPGNLNQVQDVLVSRLKAAFNNEGIEIPFPQRVLSVRNGTPAIGLQDTTQLGEGAVPETSSDLDGT